VYNSYPTNPNPLRQFQGEMGYDRDLPNLNYARNRFVDTTKGRWISRDPIGFDGGDWNLFRYTGNNPISFVDQSGNSAMVPSVGSASPTSVDYAPGPEPFTSDTCFGAVLGTVWTGVPCSEGWVIQHVRFTQSYTEKTCSSSGFYIGYEFWEAVKISCNSFGIIDYYVGGVFSPGPAVDKFDLTGFIHGKGTLTVTGHSTWYRSLPTSLSPWAPGLVPFGGASYSTIGPIPGWIESGAPKNLTVQFNCCCTPQVQTPTHTP